MPLDIAGVPTPNPGAGNIQVYDPRTAAVAPLASHPSDPRMQRQGLAGPRYKLPSFLTSAKSLK